MKPDGDLVTGEGTVFYPVARVPDQDRKLLSNLMVRDADVLLSGPIQAGPLPGLVEHAPVPFADIGFGQSVQTGEGPGVEGSRVRDDDVLPLPLVQFLLGCQIGNEIVLFVGREWRISFSACEQRHCLVPPRVIRRAWASIALSRSPLA